VTCRGRERGVDRRRWYGLKNATDRPPRSPYYLTAFSGRGKLRPETAALGESQVTTLREDGGPPVSTPRATPAALQAFHWYEEEASRRRDVPAIVSPDGDVSYSELATLVTREQNGLRSAGFSAGDRLLHADDPGSVAWVARLLAGLNLGLQVILPDQDWPREQIPRHTDPLLAAEDRENTREERPPGVWLFTSGTTAEPKPRFRSLILLRHDVSRVAVRLPADLRERRPSGLCLLPLSHGFGLINGLLLIHAVGGSVLRAEIRDRRRIAALIRNYPVEVLYSWPAHLEALADPGLWEKRSTVLRWCVSSSLSLRPAIAARFAAASGCHVRQQYGATETGPLCLDSDDPPSERTDCVGRPLDGVSVRVLDEAGECLPAGETGEIVVRVVHMTIPADEMTGDGYYRTGDRGYVDGEGRVFVLGRLRPFTDERKPAKGEEDRWQQL
jgi:acyl-coenzyme A synthetase/AMP-(fatty) acid ligase